MITETNRQDFIADGRMYEEVARLAQEAAQECMMAIGGLEWVTICDDPASGSPIRALVDQRPTSGDKSHHKTLLIATGKGKVRAGIFSRKHLLTTGMEPSTALPLLYEARQRNMRIVILDPNARGDRMGMKTFEKSMNHLFAGAGIVPSHGLYVLAHSQAGAQLVRHLQEHAIHTEEDEGVASEAVTKYAIEAVAFTDSTHNVQWTKNNPALQQLLTDARRSIYLKSAHGLHDDARFALAEAAGRLVEPTEHWRHRFGTVPTMWAGTAIHELVNWTGRHCIWNHFDGAAEAAKAIKSNVTHK